MAEDVEALNFSESKTFLDMEGQTHNYNPFHLLYYSIELQKEHEERIESLEIENGFIKGELCLENPRYSWC